MRLQTFSRRALLEHALLLGGGAMLAQLFPQYLLAQRAGAPGDAAAALRARMAAAAIEITGLTDTLTMLSGPGGNVVVLNGPDGKIVVDTFVQGAWNGLRQRLDAIGQGRISMAINTHWHFDHTDNNASFRAVGAVVVAHENTAKRLAQTHDLLGATFLPVPAAAMPSETFSQTRTLQANGERVDLAYVPPAHTDTDISVHFTRGNVLQLGDTFFNGRYPVIDAGTGGSINGMIAAADRTLGMVDAATRIVPGHGPITNREGLIKFRDMLVTVRERVQKLKAAGRSAPEAVAARPTADLDPVWSQGLVMPDAFVQMVYGTL